MGSLHCRMKKIATPIFGPAIWCQIKRSDPGPQRITDWRLPYCKYHLAPLGLEQDSHWLLTTHQRSVSALQPAGAICTSSSQRPPPAANLFPLTSNFQRRPADLNIDPPFCHLLPISSSASIVDCTACEVFGVHSLRTIELHFSTSRLLFPSIQASPPERKIQAASSCFLHSFHAPRLRCSWEAIWWLRLN